MPTTHQARKKLLNPKKAAKESQKSWFSSTDVKNTFAASRVLSATMAKSAVSILTAHVKSKTAAHLYTNRWAVVFT